MKKIFLILIFTNLLISCKKAEACDGCLAFYFENPQPINDSELDHIPNKFRGLYINKDSSYIRIEEDRILKENLWKFKIHKSKLDSLKAECEIIDGKLIANDTKVKYDLIPKGDSIELVQKYIDTLFRFLQNQKAKRIDGQLILNNRDSVLWKIKTISLEKDILKIKYSYLPNDLKKLDSVTFIKGKRIDSSSYLINPTRREFKKILKIKDLGINETYNKVLKLSIKNS